MRLIFDVKTTVPFHLPLWTPLVIVVVVAGVVLISFLAPATVVAGLTTEDELALAGEGKPALAAGEVTITLDAEVTPNLDVETGVILAERAAFSLVAAAGAAPALATAPVPATVALCSRGPSITAMVFPSTGRGNVISYHDSK